MMESENVFDKYSSGILYIAAERAGLGPVPLQNCRQDLERICYKNSFRVCKEADYILGLISVPFDGTYLPVKADTVYESQRVVVIKPGEDNDLGTVVRRIDGAVTVYLHSSCVYVTFKQQMNRRYVNTI